ncbi:hypothetical protein V1525DRAFT_414386 [Lipomyces kononenkoae]|uniref:Uncharacterized protein n=1 Tax=Lipomyces kononenkoae TaxID=34357 RepID=A0ACC3SQW5_LIPKO
MFVRQCLGDVHFSLTKPQGQLKIKLSECLRLGMMAFLATTFRLPDLYEQHYCKNLAPELQLSYAAAKASTPHLPKTTDIWLIFMLLISTDNIDELYICASWEATAVPELTWNETRGLAADFEASYVDLRF